MKKNDYKKLTEKIIKIIKKFELCGTDKITLETTIIDIINNDWVDYNIFIGNIEEGIGIEIPDDEMFYEIYDGTVKDLIDFAAEIIKEKDIKIEIDENADFINEDEIEDKNDNKKITEEEIDEIIENIDRKIEESILNEIALNKIRWSTDDKELYKNPL